MLEKIKIAVDMVFFNNNMYSGISKVWKTLLMNIKDTEKYEFLILVRGNNDNIINIVSDKKYLCIDEFNYITMDKDVDYLNEICKINECHYFISTYYTYTTFIPNILLIHDMIPEIFNLPKNSMWKQKDLAILHASEYITISNTTKIDLLQFYPFINTQHYNIHIIYNSININNHINNNLDNNILLKYNIIKKTYIFTIITNNERYKNFELINNFIIYHNKKLSKLLNTTISLIVLNKDKTQLDINNNVLFISQINDNDLYLLYQNALCYINTSLYEGFGLPIFEAFNFKIPVISLKLKIYDELTENNGCIFYIENNANELYDKICYINKNMNTTVIKKLNKAQHLLNKYTLNIQINKYIDLFNQLYTRANIYLPHLYIDQLYINQLSINEQDNEKFSFMNIIIQSYNESNINRLKELEYCIIQNLNNKYVKYVHDFNNSSNLSDYILGHKKYIRINEFSRLKFSKAFEYSNNNSNKYGIYWCIINCDIYLSDISPWLLVRGMCNNGIIFALSRHEKIDDKLILDEEFNKLLHSHTQDAWVYKTPINLINSSDPKYSYDFELGYLGCDNAIADRLHKSGYTIINKPITFKIIHYDIIRGKNSHNFKLTHKNDNNTFPEQHGTYLIPNYDLLLNNGNINTNIINQLGGLSNLDLYKLICNIMSSRIYINNQS